MKLFMRTRRVNVALLLAAIALGCTELPDAPVEDRNIATIRFVQTEPILAVGQAATFVVEARNEEGAPITNPAILWTSTSGGVAAVNGSGTSACVSARGPGNARVRASDTRGGIRAEVSVTVVACTRGPCEASC